MTADRAVTRAVNDVLALAPARGEVSLAGLVSAVGSHRQRPIEVSTAELPPGVSGQWRQYADRDEFLIQDGLPTADRTLAHELGHLVLGHDGIPVAEVARESAEFASDDLIGWTERKAGGAVKHKGALSDLEVAADEANDFIMKARIKAGWIEAPVEPEAEAEAGEVEA